MKSRLVSFWICLIVSGCAKQTELFTVRMTLNDSALSYADGRMLESARKLIESNEFIIPSLFDTLAYLQAAIADSENYAGIRYPCRLIVDLQTDVPFQSLFKIYYTAMISQCGETRLMRTLPTGVTLRVPIVANQGHGIHHIVEIRTDGIGLATHHHVIYDAPAYQPLDADRKAYSLEAGFEEMQDESHSINNESSKQERSVAALRKRGALASADWPRQQFAGKWQRPSLQLWMPRLDGQLDLASLRRELLWMRAEFKKLGIEEGRHFAMTAAGDIPTSEILEVAQVLIESFEPSESIQHAALWDASPPPIPRVDDDHFLYHNGWSARFVDFSMYFRLQRDQDSIREARRDLLCLGSLMYRAIKDTAVDDIDRLLDYGVALNDYVFGGMDVVADRRMENIDTTQEHWQDWHGYTPLLLAVSLNLPQVVRHLIPRGADVNKASKPYAYQHAIGRVAIVNFGSSSQNAPPVYTGGRVIRPLQLANEKGHMEIQEILKSAGAK